MKKFSLILLVCYPVLVHIYSLTLSLPVLWLAVSVLSTIMLLIAWWSSGAVFTAVLAIVISILLLISVNDLGQWVLKLNPVLINASLAWIFARTLQGRRTPLITQIASLLGDEIDAATRIYTRSVTLLWAVCFVLLALESAVLAFWASLHTWSLVTGFVNYLFVGLLFPLEFAVRRHCLPHLTRNGFSKFITKLMRADYRALFDDSAHNSGWQLDDDFIPLLRDPTPGRYFAYYDESKVVDVATFARDVKRVIPQLTQKKNIVNTTQNRYHFIVSFVAALCAGKITLLPPSSAREVIDKILTAYPDSLLLSDVVTEEQPNPDVLLDVRGFATAGPAEQGILFPKIKSSQTAAILFTSGCTGEPKPHAMSWFKLCNSAQQLDLLLTEHGAELNTIVATVPQQHMFGLETSVILPLQSRRPVFTPRSFYPADLRVALQNIAGKGLLVTTPVHLRVLLRADDEYPNVAMILSATAPLNPKFAIACEQRFNCSIREIYGSSETGAMATRRTATNECWQLMDGVSLESTDGGVLVRAPGLSAPVRLSDQVEIYKDGKFELRGRGQDMIKIAGKRQSLTYINLLMQSIDGVEDAIVFLPTDSADEKEPFLIRLAAMIVARGKKPGEIIDQLRQSIDPVFIPRPVYMVDQLPRNATGKLPASAVADLWNTLRTDVGEQC